ncbi:type III secretion system protein [Mailhella sp.]|uniref:type III secretion system protein n=1 Tax=Mailhella sp. TaxID=1981029 RepID=UPI003AB884CE
MVDFNTISSLTGAHATGTTDDVTKTNGSSDTSNAIPDSTEQELQKLLSELGLPDLPISSSSLSLETLLSAIGDDVRRQACRDGVASLELKAEQQAEINEKELQEIADRLEEMKKKSVLNGFLKAFKIIGAIVGAIASVASIAAGALTGNPLLIAAGAAGLVMTVDSVVSLASDGKYSIAAGFTELGKKMGMSDDTAQWFGFAMNMVIMVASVALSFGAGFASSAGSIANVGSQTVQKAAQITSMASKVTNIASGTVNVATGSATIAGAVIDYNISNSQANSKELEAILERLREAIKMDQDLVESEMERANDLMSKVREIVGECAETQSAILSVAPTMA